MRYDQTRVTLRGVEPRKRLTLRRVPTYLRFVTAGGDWGTLDALDLLGDVPRPGEHVIAAVKVDESRAHYDGTRGGRRVGWWENLAEYAAVPDQPPQDLLRDTARWRAWCVEQIGRDKTRDKSVPPDPPPV